MVLFCAGGIATPADAALMMQLGAEGNFVGSAIRATPPAARMSDGTRSRAITAAAPVDSAMRAWSAVTTSMITPPLSISARPAFTRNVAVSFTQGIVPAARTGDVARGRSGYLSRNALMRSA